MKTHTIPLIIVAALLSGCGADANARNGQNNNSETPQNTSGQANKSKNNVDSNNTTDEATQDSTQDSPEDTIQGISQNSKSGNNESYIPYLRSNHDHYSDYANASSHPLQIVINGDQVYWDIEAESETDASYLAKHIEFMVSALDKDKIPRAWDKLFVLEAFFNEQVTIEIIVDGLRVSIYKTATNSCAFELVKAHASAVSIEFFAQGDVSVDHSSAADDILAMEACSEQRNAAEAFVLEHWEPR